MVRAEVTAYDTALAERRSLSVGTKLDLLTTPSTAAVDLAVSGLTGEGIPALAQRLDADVAAARASEPPRSTYVVLRPGRDPFVVRRESDGYRVSGPRVERWVAETDLEDPKQVAELQRRLVKAGVERRLAEAGARRGDEVLIGHSAFEFIPDADAP